MKTVFYLLVLVFSVSLVDAQTCDGNLGENIFEEGDFGMGSNNLFPSNPGIAPGYDYTLNVPPFDGLYTLTNNTGAWSGNFDTWINIPDNSNNPNGYMMVVNASFDPGLFYEQEVEGLCENTLYEFTADVINLIRIGVADHIKPNVSFLIDGVSQYTTGDIPQTEQWNTYGFTFTTAPGQTSVILSLSNNAPGGIGNDLAIDNISFQPCGPLAQILPEEIESICEDGQPTDLQSTITGEQYDNPAIQWQQSFDNGLTWVDIPGANAPIYTHTDLSSGLYYYRYLLANGTANLANSKCRVVSNVKIVEVVPKFWNIIDTLCEGVDYISNNNVYTQTGIYVDSLTSSIGCDSIVTLDLTFVSDAGIEVDVITSASACFGEAEGSILIENIMNGAEPYTLFVDGLENNGFSVSNLSAGMYNILIVDFHGCSYETEVMIEDPAAFTIDIGEDQFVQLGSPITFNPIINDEVISYTWSPEIPDCGMDCLDFEFFPTNSNFYYLTAISDDGCIAIDSVYIDVEKVRKVYIPNIFSPNFDGTNDYFSPIVISPNVQSVERFQIFNRWGATLYEQYDFLPDPFSSGWDGTFKGDPVDIGIYVYLIEVRYLDGAIEQFAGDILLMR